MQQPTGEVTEEEYIQWFATVQPREQMPERLYEYFLNTYRHRFPKTYHFISCPLEQYDSTAD